MIAAVAALSAAIAIAAGAFGAHGAASVQAAEWLRTGGMYQLVHAVAVIALAGLPNGPRWALLGGSALFAATLYAMALGAPHWLGAITPIGGATMIGGWLWTGWRFARSG
ncbi:DUF423 domain-containing protein [Sphingobium nicotianae]|uniref:DUF423 domain-containing protein n=1 Tax=Sphingobium nicotianae TaxID=2782607 RepID=A0A9X1AI42_9SPHN|nr:DUF423 domain-containing protein [Sphingobium nicotianae]MBT2185606.1 DUF423 domain-containing protein [Sphingobium nicotianae]